MVFKLSFDSRLNLISNFGAFNFAAWRIPLVALPNTNWITLRINSTSVQLLISAISSRRSVEPSSMIQSNKMIYQPPKYHSNSFTHFLQLHSSINSNSSLANLNRSSEELHNGDEQAKLEIHDTSSNTSNTSLEVVNDGIGKSFTIAAILGLKKHSVNHLRQNCELDDVGSGLNDYNPEFPSLINLTAHSKLFQKFDNDNRHNYMLSPAQQSSEHPQMPIEQCMHDNNTTSNSSYQDNLHRHSINSEFNANYNRNVDDPSNPAMRNHMHQHQHVSNNLLSKAFNRDRSRLGKKQILRNKSTGSLHLKFFYWQIRIRVKANHRCWKTNV